jgi:hypothetical protein
MRPFLPVRKAFLLTALIFLLDSVLGTVIALALNLSDPAIGSARESWFTTGTALSAPGIFMIVYVLFLLLATRQRWLGTVGIVGVTLMTLSIASIADMDLTRHFFEQHPAWLPLFSLVVLFVMVPVTILLGIVVLIQQMRTRIHPALS